MSRSTLRSSDSGRTAIAKFVPDQLVVSVHGQLCRYHLGDAALTSNVVLSTVFSRTVSVLNLYQQLLDVLGVVDDARVPDQPTRRGVCRPRKRGKRRCVATCVHIEVALRLGRERREDVPRVDLRPRREICRDGLWDRLRGRCRGRRGNDERAQREQDGERAEEHRGY